MNSINAIVDNALQAQGNKKIDQTLKNMERLSERDLNRIKEAAQDFEAVFISQMMSHMFEGIEVDPMFGGGKGEEMFRSMIVDEYGKQMASQGGIGLAEHVQAKMIEVQAAHQSQRVGDE